MTHTLMYLQAINRRMKNTLPPVAVWSGVTAEVFRNEIVSQYRPAVIRGLVANWPAVELAKVSDVAVCDYLRGLDNRRPVDAIMTPPQANGRIFYDEKLEGFNYLRNLVPLSNVMEQVMRYAAFPHPPAVAVQSALISDCLPTFEALHAMPLLRTDVRPRIWLGNRITTPAHIDESNNIACVVAGKRRFTLFPPDQISNLYLGPLDKTPTGSPISMVDLEKPDYEQFPRFRDALAAAQVAELEPGDALYIPSLWWHHVQSLDSLNILVNYWWRATATGEERFHSAFDALMHTLVNLKDLPAPYRAAWGAIFNHYVFDASQNDLTHIPPARRGVLGDISAQHEADIRAWLVERLKS
jgi:hypothetical protein